MLTTDGAWFKDALGRTLLLRGVNVSGLSKVPRSPDGATHQPQSLDHPESVSFVGRPFPLADADEHFRRLRAFGLTFLRFVITWEAVEHEGPGLYDRAYLDYLYEVVRRAHQHGLLVYIDPHQDVWSRFTGGDGAPAWTLTAVGFDLAKLTLPTTGATFLHQRSAERPLQGIIWPTNYTKLGAATMFTVFFAGDDFAPRCRVGDESVQKFLQRHYCAAMAAVARRLADLPNVVGYGTMNEPGSGYIGLPLLEVPAGMVKKGPSPTPLQGMLLGAGHPQEVEVWEMGAGAVGQQGTVTLNRERLSVYAKGRADLWREHGVFTDEGGVFVAPRPDYFQISPSHGGPVNFAKDYLKPFCERVLAAVRSVSPTTLLFFEGPPMPVGKPPPFTPDEAPGLVHAPHWYDGMTLFMKRFFAELVLDLRDLRPVLGEDAVRESIAAQMAHLRDEVPGMPALLGEFGISFDLDEKRAYRDDDFSMQVAALDRSFRGIEDALLSCTLWNYTPDNDNENGDQWNAEDLSIWSRDQQREPSDIYSGGRALAAVVRPYARATCGRPLAMSYDVKTRSFRYEFEHDDALASAAVTELFVPSYAYPSGYEVEISDGTWERGQDADTLLYRHSEAQRRHTLLIRPR